MFRWDNSPTPTAPASMRSLLLTGKVVTRVPLVFVLNNTSAYHDSLLCPLLHPSSDSDDLLS